MKKYKISRNLWLFSGLCFLIVTILKITKSNDLFEIILNASTSGIMFINAYIHHRKITSNKTSENKFGGKKY